MGQSWCSEQGVRGFCQVFRFVAALWLTLFHVVLSHLCPQMCLLFPVSSPHLCPWSAEPSAMLWQIKAATSNTVLPALASDDVRQRVNESWPVSEESRAVCKHFQPACLAVLKQQGCSQEPWALTDPWEALLKVSKTGIILLGLNIHYRYFLWPAAWSSKAFQVTTSILLSLPLVWAKVNDHFPMAAMFLAKAVIMSYCQTVVFLSLDIKTHTADFILLFLLESYKRTIQREFRPHLSF